MTLNRRHFEALDHLHLIDADTRWIDQADLATTLNTSTEATHVRMRRLEAANLIDIQRATDQPIRYRISAHGLQMYRATLLRMDGVTGPPPLHPDIERATLATLALHAYGTEAAA